MNFFQVYLQSFLVIMILMTILWIISIIIRNVSIVDIFWGLGFVLASLVYYLITFIVLNLMGGALDFGETFSLVILPSLLLNLLFAIPIFWLMRDLSRWANPIEEED